MSTTTLFVEYLVIGSQAMVWLGLLLASFINLNSFAQKARHYKDLGIFSTVIGVGIIYTLGVTIERISGAILPTHVAIRWVEAFPMTKEWQSRVDDAKTKLVTRENRMRESLDYGLARIRVVRSALLNTALAYGALLLFYHHRKTLRGKWLKVTGYTTLVFLIFTIALAVMVGAYSCDLRETDKFLEQRQQSAPVSKRVEAGEAPQGK
ncbi:MAG: hypothetical protein FJ388_04465 [Verrucomicrobia bacterium]|nr:hypothetical protein [Verrucomicrobiota bacterium]